MSEEWSPFDFGELETVEEIENEEYTKKPLTLEEYNNVMFDLDDLQWSLCEREESREVFIKKIEDIRDDVLERGNDDMEYRDDLLLKIDIILTIY